MLIRFYNQAVSVKEVTIGCVVFLTNISDKSDKTYYQPLHVVGFGANGFGELTLKLQTFDGQTEIHPGNLAWDNN